MKSGYAIVVLTVSLTSLFSVVADQGWFWHVTDFHYDLSYSDLDLSCNGDVTNHGKYGDYWCDAPWRLITSSVEAMTRFKPDVDFVLWTGDNVMHASDDNLSVDITDEILGNLTDLMSQCFGSTPVYPTFGNHDYYPKNQFPPTNNELYNRTLERWLPWIRDEGEKENFRKGGYYTVMTSHRIRIAALNTNLYHTSDKLTGSLTDPADQFVWLENLLANAVINTEKVLVIGHVPPGMNSDDGTPWMYQHFNTKMNDVIRKYSDVIIALHFGHEHFDNFRVYTKAGVPETVLFLAPSVTPWRDTYPGSFGPAHNPALRLVNYDRQTGRHLNIIQYYMDLPASNSQGMPIWAEEYNATRDYAIDDLSPRSMFDLVQRMGVANSPEFTNYYKWRVVNVTDGMMEKCGDLCKANIVCNLCHVDQSSYNTCVMEAVGGSAPIIPSRIVLLICALLTHAYL